MYDQQYKEDIDEDITDIPKKAKNPKTKKPKNTKAPKVVKTKAPEIVEPNEEEEEEKEIITKKPLTKINHNHIPLGEEPYYSDIKEKKITMERPANKHDNSARQVNNVKNNLKLGDVFNIRVKLPSNFIDGTRLILELTTDDHHTKILHTDLRLWKLVFNTKEGNWNANNEGMVDIPDHLVKPESTVDIQLKIEDGNYRYLIGGESLGTYKFHVSADELSRVRNFLLISTIDVKFDENKYPAGVVIVKNEVVGDISEYDNYNYLIKDHQYEFLIGVLTAPRNFVHRWSVRKSWLKYPHVKDRKNLVRFFVAHTDDKSVMEMLQYEQNMFGDIVMMPHKDEYRSIGRKTLGMCHYAAKIKAKYLLKCDDDTFVRMQELEKRVSGLENKLFLLGSISHGASPHRDPKSKWYMSPSDFSGNTYPPFPHGPGYVIPLKVCEHIAAEDAKGDLKVLALEDVSMAIWVDHAIHQHGMAIEYMNDHRFDAGSCNNNMITGHYIEPDRHIRIFNRDINNEHPICQ